VYLINERKLNARTVGHHTTALRFFFCKTLKRCYPLEEVPYPKAPRRLPTILTQEEVVRLIDSASNLFHRAMLMTAYRIVQNPDHLQTADRRLLEDPLRHTQQQQSSSGRRGQKEVVGTKSRVARGTLGAGRESAVFMA
jgi:integrase